MSVEAFALSFFDPDRDLYGTARSGATLLFHGREPAAHADGPQVTEHDDGWRAELGERLALSLQPVSAEVDLDGVTARICRVTGTVDGTSVDCLGTFSITTVAPLTAPVPAKIGETSKRSSAERSSDTTGSPETIV